MTNVLRVPSSPHYVCKRYCVLDSRRVVRDSCLRGSNSRLSKVAPYALVSKTFNFGICCWSKNYTENQRRWFSRIISRQTGCYKTINLLPSFHHYTLSLSQLNISTRESKFCWCCCRWLFSDWYKPFVAINRLSRLVTLPVCLFS